MRKKTAALEVLRPDANFRHIAFIMDGNGRWAKKRGMPREYGHKVGSAAFKKVCLYCCDIGFQAVTVYAFSTENWKRPPHEVDTIMGILDDYLEELKRDYPKYHNRFRFIGDLSVLTPALREKIAYVETLNAQEHIAHAVYTAECGDPDMIVRTGGDLRLSNFLLWQAAYAELYFTEKLWPDFGPADVDECVREFYSRKRRWGGL